MNTLSHKVGNGFSIRFWKDSWNGNGTLMSRQVEGSRNEVALDSLLSDLGQVQILDELDSWQWTHPIVTIPLLPDFGGVTDGTRAKNPSSLSGPLMETVNIFVWRLSLDRLPTWLNLSLRGLDIPSVVCPMCNDVVEAVDHVFFGCDLSSDVWRLVRRWTNIDMPSFSSWFGCLQWFEDWRASRDVKDRVYVIFVALLWCL
ncbi:RNA-directed DNA polymerase, eukaryota, reverse transcriptase zinc-binding domain protein [Tanacetum coccineum]